ncbi:hypothetical protein IBX65_08375 [Candidatus Aerophobetes bacterium]|nr:hypothetical protein [Candidatus Aerophobetes bacterium]
MDSDNEFEEINKKLIDLEWRVRFLEMGMEDSVEFSKFVIDCLSELEENIKKLKER